MKERFTKEKIINCIAHRVGPDEIQTDKKPVEISEDNMRLEIGDEGTYMVLEGQQVAVGGCLYKKDSNMINILVKKLA